jgi:Fe-S-cluster containining protein
MTPPETITGEVTLTVAGEAMTVEVTVPTANTAVADLLPLFRGLTNALVDRATVRDTATGRSVSCRAGCGACCRQAVPIAPSEARALAALVDALPEPRRSRVRDRFAAARATLAAAGVDTDPAARERRTHERYVNWSADYMAARVACPFLENESCSIHPERPVICREYLVTTPPENCATPNNATVRRVPIAGSVATALFRVDKTLEDHGRLFLVDSLDWVARHPAPVPSQPGPAIVQTLFAALAAEA